MTDPNVIHLPLRLTLRGRCYVALSRALIWCAKRLIVWAALGARFDHERGHRG